MSQNDLYTLLIAPGLRRRHLVNDGAQLTREKVASFKGVKGLALKGALKTLEKAVPGALDNIIDRILDESIEKIEPVYAEHCFKHGGAEGFANTLIEQKDEVTEAWLQVFDQKAERISNKKLLGLYKSLRPKGHGYIVESMADIAELLEKTIVRALDS